MRLALCSIFVLCLTFVSQINANEKSYIVVLGGPSSVVSRGINARVSVSNNGKVTKVDSSFGQISIDNQLVDPRNGYVIEGNDSLEGSNCNSGELKKIIISCTGKLLVRAKTPEDSRRFGFGSY